MKHSYVDLARAESAGLAEGHRYWFGWVFPHTSYTTGLIPAGGVISTAPDMARYLRMMLNGGELDGHRVLSRQGVATLTSPVAATTVGPWAKDPDVSYGMGWYVGGGPFGPEPAVFHPGGSPDFGSMAVLLPAQEQGLVLLYNVTPEVELPGAAGMSTGSRPVRSASSWGRTRPAAGRCTPTTSSSTCWRRF
ncbi:MAG: beta-lactamase family protein [Solirubrobacterales bacterium]|nr:beta-lactamase family protein [Solirubrobacterales bacterium]